MTPEYLLTLLIAHAAQIAIVCGVAGLIIRCVPASHPRFVSGLWLIVLIKCLLPPVLPGPLSGLMEFTGAPHRPDNSAQQLSEPTPLVTPAQIAFAESELLTADHLTNSNQTSTLPPGSEQRSNGFMVRMGELVSGLSIWCEQWLLSTVGRRGITFVLLLLIAGALHRMIATIIQFSRSMQDISSLQNEELSELLQHRVNVLGNRLGLRIVPKVVVSDSLYGPAVMGLHRRVIVLPACLVTRHTTDTLDPILAHELLHIRRNDLLKGLLQTIAQIFWWFHPAVRFLNERLTHSIEQCCDEAVISELGCSRSTYARCLLAVIEGKQQIKPIPVLPGMRPVEITSLRMERIMKPGLKSVSRGLQRRQTALLLIVALLILPGIGTRWTADGAQQTEQPQSTLPTPRQEVLLISMLLLQGEQESITALIEESSNTKKKLQKLSDVPVVFDRSENHMMMQILKGVQQPPEHLQVISRPRIQVLSGSSGTIQIGQQAEANSDMPDTDPEVYGLSIDVTPSLTSNQNVDVNLSIKLSEKLGASPIALISNNGDVAESVTQPQTRLIKVSTDFSMQTNQAVLIRGRSENTPDVQGEILLMMHVDVVDENNIAVQRQQRESEVDETTQMSVRAYAISDIEIAAGQQINGDSKTGDYTPILEFIRSATGGQENWGEPFSNKSRGTMMIDENSQTLVVRQTTAVHDQIATLLQTLRSPEEQIVVQCTVFSVPSTSTSVAPWIDQNLKFLSPIDGRPWTQLTPEQGSQFLAALTSDSSVSQLLAPRLMASNRQQAMIQSQTPNGIDPGGFSITVQPTIRGNDVIELSHHVVVGKEDPASAKTQTAFVLNGQLLIVQLERSYLMLQAIRADQGRAVVPDRE